ncbi:MAG TPA: M56 family metallopeptidase, partial [Planctomycetota bacterium]|nr:M56 family metallopeptidase [Planctomycetota bacterium]
PLGGRLPLRRAVASDEARAPEKAPFPQLSGHEASTPRQLGIASPALSGDAAVWYGLLANRALGKLEAGTAKALQSLLANARPSDGLAVASEPEPRASAEPALASAAGAPWFARIGPWTQWAFATCVLGALGGLLLFALLWMRLNGCLRDRVVLQHGALADKLRDLCRRTGIRRRVRLSVAPSLGAPISMGMFRPEICVPPRVLLELSEEEQEVLLAHELAHVVRRDPLWLATCRLCEAVFFFQPLNRVARHEIEDCAEFLSDAWAVRHTGLRFSLASCLTRIAEWIVGERRTLPAPAMAHGRSRLRHRVELLLDESAVQRAERRPRWLGFACTGFCATLVAVVPCVSASEETRPPGDGGNLSFLPERDGTKDAPAFRPAPEPAAETACTKTEDSCAKELPEPADEAPVDELDFTGELDALEEEFAGLCAGAKALSLDDARALELSLELQLMQMKLAKVRELISRIDALRDELSPAVTIAPAPASALVREARSSSPRTSRTNNSTSTHTENFEETLK